MNEKSDEKNPKASAGTSECARCEKLAAQVLELKEQVSALTDRLGKTSQNASKPPSSGPPGTPSRPSRKPSGRKRGGQPGHERATRPLIPTEQADKVIPLKPDRCEKCSRKLDGNDLVPRRHPVAEIDVRTRVTEYEQHTLKCVCGHQTTAELPEEAGSCFGVHLESAAALLTGAYHLSKRSAQEILRDLFGVEMSLGALRESGNPSAGTGGGSACVGSGPSSGARGRNGLERREPAGAALGSAGIVGDGFQGACASNEPGGEGIAGEFCGSSSHGPLGSLQHLPRSAADLPGAPVKGFSGIQRTPRAIGRQDRWSPPAEGRGTTKQPCASGLFGRRHPATPLGPSSPAEGPGAFGVAG